MPHLRHQQSIGVDGVNCPTPLPSLSPLEQIFNQWAMHMEMHL